MKIQSWILAVCLALVVGTASSWAVTVQDPVNNVLEDGSAFLWIEAEDAFELNGGDPEDAVDGFVLVDNEDPIQTISEVDGTEVPNGGRDVLPEDTNASGGEALFMQLTGGGTAKWQAQFEIPATYYLYMHYSFYNRDTNTNYGNEDSIYLPPSFNANSRSDWIGFEGVDQFGDPKTGDSNRDGWMPLGKDIESEGEIETHNSTDEDFWEGQFHWALMDVAVDMDENDSFIGDFGHGIRYDVSEDDTGTVMDFEISAREPYGVIDGLLFSTNPELLFEYSQDQMDEFFLSMVEGVPGDFNGDGMLGAEDIDLLSAEVRNPTGDDSFDVNGDGMVDDSDRVEWVEVTANTFFGDSNFDLEFNSGDLVTALAAGKYETGDAAGWGEGDWDGNGLFDSSDFVTALAAGGYEQGPRQAVAAVPEPSAAVLVCMAGAGLFCCRSRFAAS